MFAYEMQDFGTELKALNGQPNDNPAGKMFNRMMASFAEYERDLITDRTSRGRMGRARAGLVVPTRCAPYGFDYVPEVGNYRVNDDMAHVREIFAAVASGRSLSSVCNRLKRDNIPTANGGQWYTSSIRYIIEKDVYKPHTGAELAAMVQPEVAARLDSGGLYGVQWYNRNRNRSRKTHDETKTRTITPNGRESWVAVPVPDAGVPLEDVIRARAAIKDNVRASNAGRRPWPLKGRLYCPCGRRMTTHTANRRDGHKDFYYVCPARREGCEHRKFWPAEQTEARVEKVVSDLTQNPDALTEAIAQCIERERAELKDASREVEGWLKRLAELDKQEENLIDLAADGALPKDKVRARLAKIEANKAEAQRELEKLQDSRERLAEVEGLEDFTMWGTFGPNGVVFTWSDDEPEDSPYSYESWLRRFEIKATPYLDGELEVAGVFDTLRCNSEAMPISPPGRRAGPTS